MNNVAAMNIPVPVFDRHMHSFVSLSIYISIGQLNHRVGIFFHFVRYCQKIS